VTSTPIDVQIINQDNQPAFAVMPYSDYLALMQSIKKVDPTIPHAVAGLCVRQRISLLAAWRIHRGLSRSELAQLIGMTEAAITQMERSDQRLQRRTLQRLADALSVVPEQLV
jgi:DNA-binding Xre family transcriptional regulator